MGSTFKLPRAVLVAGGGVSGRGCASILDKLGADVTVADSNLDTRMMFARELGVKAIDPAEVTFAIDSRDDGHRTPNDNAVAYDMVVTSPGWRPDSPLLRSAATAGIEVIGDVELAWRLDRAEIFGPPRTWLVITGTNGKTTTTGMLAGIMRENEAETGLRATEAGNIGVSLFSALSAKPRIDVLCVELSSFQLHWSSSLRPHVGTVLNLAEDHIDWHGSFDNYARDKAKAFLGDVAVIALDDERVVQSAKAIHPPGMVTTFTTGQPQGGGIGIVGRDIVGGAPPVVLASAVGLQPAGIAGIADACAAAAVAFSAGATAESISKGLGAYRVDPHRGEIVHLLDGVRFIDNSKATNPHAVDAALAGLSNVIWIAGGQLKGADIDELVSTHREVIKAAVLLGQDRETIADALKKYSPQVPVDVIDEKDPELAMKQAVAAAFQHAEFEDTVLLAPAAASLDMYSGMGHRGDLFSTYARALPTSQEPKR